VNIFLYSFEAVGSTLERVGGCEDPYAFHSGNRICFNSFLADGSGQRWARNSKDLVTFLLGSMILIN
jgi:hypothetical protein